MVEPRRAPVHVLRNNGVVKIAEAPSEAVTDRAGRHRVAGSLLAEGPATASDLAVRLGISATAVRRHLDNLMADGLVEASERPPYGPQPVRRRGRPAKTFSLTEDGRSQFPADYDELANAAMAFVRTMGGRPPLRLSLSHEPSSSRVSCGRCLAQGGARRRRKSRRLEWRRR